MTDAIRELIYVEGFISAMGAVLQDRENVEGLGYIARDVDDAVTRLETVEHHIDGLLKEAEGLREELHKIRSRHPDELQKWVDDQNTEAVISAGR